jgi:hypothetical protein
LKQQLPDEFQPESPVGAGDKAVADWTIGGGHGVSVRVVMFRCRQGSAPARDADRHRGG